MRAKRKTEEAFSLADLSDRAKERAHSWFLRDVFTDDLFDVHEQKYWETEYFEPRGIEVSRWSWDVGAYRGHDYVTVQARVSPSKWLAWYVRTRTEAMVGPFKREEDRPQLQPWVYALETIIESGEFDDSWHLASASHGARQTTDFSGGYHDEDITCTEGPLAGALMGELLAIIEQTGWSAVDEAVLASATEINDMVVESIRGEIEHRESMEHFEEMAEANDWKFDEEGEMA
jgi:hypothetical protein